MPTEPSASESLVTIHASDDLAQQGVVRAALDAAGIQFFVRHDQLQHLVGYGQIGGFNLAVGPTEVQVAQSDARQARDLVLDALASPLETSADSGDRDSEVTALVDAKAARYARIAAVSSLLWLGGLGSLVGVVLGIRALDHFISPTPINRACAISAVALGLLGLLQSALAYFGLS